MGIVKGLATASAANRQALNDDIEDIDETDKIRDTKHRPETNKNCLQWSGRRESNPRH